MFRFRIPLRFGVPALLAVLLVAIVAIIGAPSALAATAPTPVDEATAALKSGQIVYVHKNAPNVTNDTAAELRLLLRDATEGSDHVVLAMLPASATSTGSPETILNRLDTASGGDKIVGVSIGDQTYATSTRLPEAKAADLMATAQRNSSNTTAAMVTFIDLVHKFQATSATPTVQPNASTPPTNQESGFSFGDAAMTLAKLAGIVIVSFGIGALMALLRSVIVLARLKRTAIQAREIQLKASPKVVQAKLAELRLAATNIDRSTEQGITLVSSIDDIVRDTEHSFKVTAKASSRSTDMESSAFVNHLATGIAVLEKAADVQKNRRYYPDADALLKQSADAIQGLAAFALRAAQRKASDDLPEFNANLALLDAQRAESQL